MQTMKHLNSFTEGNLTTLLGLSTSTASFKLTKGNLNLTKGNLTTCFEFQLQQTTLDEHRKTTALNLVNPHGSVPGHCFHYEAESEQLLHCLPVLPTKVESCPTAHEVRETQRNLRELTHLLVVHRMNLCAYVHTCADNITKQAHIKSH